MHEIPKNAVEAFLQMAFFNIQSFFRDLDDCSANRNIYWKHWHQLTCRWPLEMCIVSNLFTFCHVKWLLKWILICTKPIKNMLWLLCISSVFWCIVSMSSMVWCQRNLMYNTGHVGFFTLGLQWTCFFFFWESRPDKQINILN